MATYRITTKTGESYKIESPNELSNEELAGYAENPLGEQSQPEPANSTELEPTKPTFSQIQKEQTGKDIADLKGLYNRSVERGSSVYQPTTIGEALKQKPGTIGEAIVGTPERALRLGSATVGTAADAVNTGLKIATRGLIGEKPGELATSAIQKTGLPELVAPAIKKYQEFKSNLDPASRANIGAAESGLSALGTFGGIKTGEGVAKRLVGEGGVLKESGPKGVVKALVDPLKKETGAISPNKPYTIPDIDDIADVEDAAKSVVDLPKNMGEIKKNIGQPPKKGIRNYALTVDEQEFLSKPESLTETPFPVVMQQASLAKQKRLEGVLTPLDKAAADKGGEALKLISAKKSEIGKIKGDLVDAADDYLIATNQFADATPIQQRFVELVRDRLGAQFDEKGRLVDAAGRVMNDSSEKTLVMKMARTINKLRPETTLKELDDVVMDLRNMVEHKKSSQTKQIFTKADGIGEAVRGDIKNLIDDHLENSVNWGGADDFLGKEGVATLKGSLRDYANIAKIEDRLNRGLGEVVDPVTGQAKMGASLLKSSLMSNSDRGTKALFRAVNDLTGIDLMKEAAKAEIAMKAVGDDRINDLLKEAGAIRSLAQGDKAGALLKLGEKAAQKWTGEKPDQLLRYYYKHHPDAEMVIPEPKKDVLRTYQRPPKKQETIGEALGGRSTGLVRVESKPIKPEYTETNYPKRDKSETIGEALRPASKIDDSDPFEESLLTPKQFKEKQAAEKLQALQGEEVPDYNPDELLTPEDYAQKRHFEEMDKAYRGKDSGMQVRDEANSVKVGIRKSLGLPGSREIRMENLSPKKQAEINRYAADITANPMMRESFRDAGLIDANTERVHPDDVVRWMNESKKEKPSTIGDVLKRTLGNERGAVGGFDDYDEMVYSKNIVPVHGVKDKNKFELIKKDLEENGWNERPILGVDYGNGTMAFTGSHRLAAAKELEMDVPVKLIDPDDLEFALSLEDMTLDELIGSGDDRVADFLNRHGFNDESKLMEKGSSALKTMAATGATAAGALTIGEAIKAKKKK